MTDERIVETEKYTDENGNEVEVNTVIYERTDGTGLDLVEQTKVNGVEVGHYTEHPDGTIHKHGCYADDEEDNSDNTDEDEN